MKELAPGIIVFEKSFENPQWVIDNVESISKKEPRFSWIWAKTSNTNNLDDSVRDTHRTNKLFPLSGYSSGQNPMFCKQIDEFVFNKTTEYIKSYAEKNELGGLEDEGYSILKYQDGAEYKNHYDCGPGTNKRVVSMLAYLNEEYSGGELEFVNFGIKYKPSAGDIILFPSSYIYSHIAHPVTSGTKYAIVTWLGFSERSKEG